MNSLHKQPPIQIKEPTTMTQPTPTEYQSLRQALPNDQQRLELIKLMITEHLTNPQPTTMKLELL